MASLVQQGRGIVEAEVMDILQCFENFPSKDAGGWFYLLLSVQIEPVGLSV
jgi:hypothetical protein